MKRFTLAMMALVFAVSMPMIATAGMDHGMKMDQDKAMDQGMKMDQDKAMDHGMKMDKGMKMADQDGDFVEIGKDTQAGVVATVKVKTYDEKTLASMKKMGMDATHHVMVFFTDEKSGNEIASGKAALKVKGAKAKPVMMMQMGAGFGGDVTLKGAMSTFEIGTKLEDGKKRKFLVMFHDM